MAEFRFLPPAEAELLQQISYYSAVRPELGVQFEEAVAEAVRKAVEYPAHGAPRPKNTRRRLVNGFPFAVIYKEVGDGILVVAMADGRRKPDYWVRRLK
ncbi:MAG: type II toxin-antitoxin system RelE/ParE family toxin [Rubrivivax sp.]